MIRHAERDGGELRRRACQQLHKPRPAGAVALGMPVHHHGTDDQHLAQISIACLSDAAQGHLVARGVRDSPRGDLALPIAWTKANGHQKVTTFPRETGPSCSS